VREFEFISASNYNYGAHKTMKIIKTTLKAISVLLLVFALLVVVLHIATNYIVNRPLNSEPAFMTDVDNYQYYFAYGANMSAKYLANIRKVRALESKPAKLDGYALTFNLAGVNFIEPGFANIRASDIDHVEGVVHRVTEADINKILRSEPDKYQIVDVHVQVAGELVVAKSLIFVSDSPETYKPSKRYVNMLAKAAREHGLSKEYVEKIESTEYVYYPGLSEAFGTVIFLAVMFNSK
jgi:cation transport regulator ChaC